MYTTADEIRDDVITSIKHSRGQLATLIYQDVHGWEDYTEEFRKKAEEALKLISAALGLLQ